MLSKGMQTFMLIWVGQLVSFIGTSMTQFALTIWVWQETGQATSLALMSFFAFAPTILLSPLAGVLVDRYDRKGIMILSDLGAGLASVVIFLLLSTDTLQLWHLYILSAWVSAFAAFQFPAYSAAISMMVDKTQYARTSGLLSVAESASSIVAPVLAGILLGFLGLQGILLIDIITFLVALMTLWIAVIPKLEEPKEPRLNIWQDSLFGFRYIWQHKPLLAIQLVFFLFNIVAGFSFFMVSPLILARTGSNAIILASIEAAMGIGGLVGGLVLTIWGGPKKRIHGILLSMAVSSIFGSLLLGLGQHSVIWIIASFFIMGTVPIMNGSNQAIWQSKVPASLQGRVFAVRRLIAQLSMPVSMILAGLLADRVFEPAMMPTGSLAPIFGNIVGVGKGAGIGLMSALSGILGILIIAVAYLIPSVTRIETLLPDHDF
jgi:MFS transporter, DHA3 family, macrolide efflux protein